jgi:hypothetical protein
MELPIGSKDRRLRKVRSNSLATIITPPRWWGGVIIKAGSPAYALVKADVSRAPCVALKLAATDSPTGEGSTIGAPGLNDSVRNGKR